MRALPLSLPAAVLAVLTPGCGPSAAESGLLERIASLREEGRLPALEVAEPPGARDFFTRFQALDARLEDFPLNDRAALDAFHEAVAELLDLKACRGALRAGTSLPGGGTSSPKLMVMREWTDRLRARARLAAREAGGGPAAIESLVTAFELLALTDDGSLIGLIIRLSQERWLIETIEEVAPAVDANALLTALAPHLRARGREALDEVVAFETAVFLHAVETVLRADARLSEEDLEVFGFADVGLVAGAQGLIDRFEGIRDAEEPCPARLGTPEDEPARGARLLYALSEWHAHEVRLERARIALAIEARRQAGGAWPAELAELGGGVDGSPPVPPCSRLRYDYGRTETGFRLEAVDRILPAESETRAAGVGAAGLDRR